MLLFFLSFNGLIFMFSGKHDHAYSGIFHQHRNQIFKKNSWRWTNIQPISTFDLVQIGSRYSTFARKDVKEDVVGFLAYFHVKTFSVNFYPPTFQYLYFSPAVEFEVFQCLYSFIKRILDWPRKWIPNLLISSLGSLDNIAEHHKLIHEMLAFHS